MIFVCSSTVSVMLCQLPVTSNPKTVAQMCYAVLDAIRLKSHHGRNYKYPPITARSTTDTLWVSTNQK